MIKKNRLTKVDCDSSEPIYVKMGVMESRAAYINSQIANAENPTGVMDIIHWMDSNVEMSDKEFGSFMFSVGFGSAARKLDPGNSTPDSDKFHDHLLKYLVTNHKMKSVELADDFCVTWSFVGSNMVFQWSKSNDFISLCDGSKFEIDKMTSIKSTITELLDAYF